MMYYVYMLRCHDDSIYTGITVDIQRRIKEHVSKSKVGAQYTKTRDVVALDALWTCENRSLASKLEYKIKKLSKADKELLINNPDEFEDYEVVEALSEYQNLFTEDQ